MQVAGSVRHQSYLRSHYAAHIGYSAVTDLCEAESELPVLPQIFAPLVFSIIFIFVSDTSAKQLEDLVEGCSFGAGIFRKAETAGNSQQVRLHLQKEKKSPTQNVDSFSSHRRGLNRYFQYFVFILEFQHQQLSSDFHSIFIEVD